jgi:hypothetical protein
VTAIIQRWADKPVIRFGSRPDKPKEPSGIDRPPALRMLRVEGRAGCAGLSGACGPSRAAGPTTGLVAGGGVSFARSWAAIGAASGDESGGEEEFGYVAAVVHDLRAALNLGDRAWMSIQKPPYINCEIPACSPMAQPR